ncbi:tumor susceptibility gene 101 protein-like [Clavelina lepadiformis]|uniref:tumor susceptibility gene 101 protein-like n=1 Tax=Clavelina lepadiformis TaxID=159417 RepID=UPI00404237D6
MVRQYDLYLQQHMKGKYSQLEVAKQDARNAMKHYKDLRPNVDNFMYNNGTSKSLMSLTGTIPVNYKGTTYNIPIAIWLQEAHPQVAPICYVRPTSSMQVRQGKHVDSNGRVYMPYLNEWRQGSHNLIGCIQLMCVVFGEEPPVYAKQGTPARPPPPPPQSQPYPPQPVRPPYPTPGFTAQGPPTTNYQPNFRPQMPPYPSNPAQPGVPYPTNATSGFPPYAGYPPPNNAPMMTNTPYPPQPMAQSNLVNSTIDETMIKASLLSAVNDKLKRRMKDTCTLIQTEMTELKQTERELRDGQDKLDKIIKRLHEENSDADANMLILQQKNEELEKELERLQDKQDNLGDNMDDVVMATTPVYRQIVSSFAEEQSLEDTIYYLGEALHKDVLDLETFLKHVRSLSRQQFMLRAIIQKARKSAGLASVY